MSGDAVKQFTLHAPLLNQFTKSAPNIFFCIISFNGFALFFDKSSLTWKEGQKRPKNDDCRIMRSFVG